MNNFRLVSVMLICATAMHAHAAAGPLETARKLATSRYKGWSYGSNASKKQVDCVQFVLAVLETTKRMSLSARARTRILISDISATELKKDQYKVVRDGDSRTKGVQEAIAANSWGKRIDIADVKAGDFVQYWMKRKNGSWFGHAGIIASVRRTKSGARVAIIYGAHASPKPNGTIGNSRITLILKSGPDRRIYIARLKGH